MPTRVRPYQCKACGAILEARERRPHLHERHDLKVSARQVSDAFTTTLDPFHPGRASKWGYDDDEIRQVIPGLQEPPAATPQAGPRYPNITVGLIGTDGNCFALLGKVLNALRQGGVSEVERDAFKAEATAGDYDHLLQVIMTWVEVE